MNDDEIRRGTKTDSSARRCGGKLRNAFAGGIGNLLRHTAEGLGKAVERERRVFYIQIDRGGHGGVGEDGSHFSCDDHNEAPFGGIICLCLL